MTVLGTILGSKAIIEGGLKLIDNLHTSDEEEIQAKVQGKINLLKAYAPFKVAQRYIALLFTFNFIISFWVAVGLWAYGKDMEGFLAIMSAFNLGLIMTMIVGFYFGGGFLESALNKDKK